MTLEDVMHIYIYILVFLTTKVSANHRKSSKFVCLFSGKGL
jgi:hypothetical protein